MRHAPVKLGAHLLTGCQAGKLVIVLKPAGLKLLPGGDVPLCRLGGATLLGSSWLAAIFAHLASGT